MKTIVICGHGGWAPLDGYAQVPKGCSIAFYTDFSKTLAGDEANQIAAGTYPHAPKQVIQEFKVCPNFRFYPENTIAEKEAIIALKGADRELLFTWDATGRPLKHLFETLNPTAEIAFHWACCLYTQLNQTPGSAQKGINLTQKQDGYYEYDYTNRHYVKIF